MARMKKAYLLLVALALCLPSPLGAQGGDAVYRTVRVEFPIEAAVSRTPGPPGCGSRPADRQHEHHVEHLRHGVVGLGDGG